MKNKKIFLIVLICIIVVAITICIIAIKSKNNNKPKIEERGYYSYFDKNGIIKINLEEFVKLPENYKSYKTNNNESIIDAIMDNSEVKVPASLLQEYKNDTAEMLKRSAEKEKVDLETFLMEHYGITKIESYLKFYDEYFIKTIKRDLIYQALAKDLNIKIKEKNVKEYFKEALNNGNSYDDLKYNYGEKLMYIYTMENAVETELKK